MDSHGCYKKSTALYRAVCGSQIELPRGRKIEARLPKKAELQSRRSNQEEVWGTSYLVWTVVRHESEPGTMQACENGLV